MLSFSFSIITVAISLSYAFPVGNNSSKSYAGYQLWKVTPNSLKDEAYLEDIFQVGIDKQLMEFWEYPNRLNPVIILVPPNVVNDFLLDLQKRHLKPDVIISDMEERLLDEESSPRLAFLSRYHTYDQIKQYLKDLQHQYPHLVQTYSIGNSVEQRTIDVIKIGSSNGGVANKRAIYIDAGVHAREWIAPATALYFISELVENYETNNRSKELVDSLNWYIIPIANPDGYEYSRDHDRLWRDNRNKNAAGVAHCQGVDINRNFDYHWEQTKGASTDPCHENYKGPNPFSEPESRVLRDFMLQHSSELDGYITLHSWSQKWMYPYGHKVGTYPDDINDLKDVAERAAKKLQEFHNSEYVVDTVANILYLVSGSAHDWAKAKANIKYAYIIELRPDNYAVQFLLPEDEILPCGEETWAGVQVVAEEILKRQGITLKTPAPHKN